MNGQLNQTEEEMKEPIRAPTRQVSHRFPYSFGTSILPLLVIVVALVWDISEFHLPGVDSMGIHRSESDVIILAFLLVIPAFLVDRAVARQRRHEYQFQAEPLRVLRVTMRTVQDIVNNNLSQLQLFRLEAESHMPDGALTLFDETIHATAAQLTALGNTEIFAEKPMAMGSGLDISTGSVSHGRRVMA